MNLGVYISCRNDDLVIRPCVLAVKKVFPQVEVIDVGSKDETIKIVSRLGVPIYEEGNVKAAEYPKIKNKYIKRHDWCFWVDADEIYPEASLRKLKDKINNLPDERNTINVLWRLVQYKDGRLWHTLPTHRLCSKSRAIESKSYYYWRAWPDEVLHREPSVKKGRKEGVKDTDFDIWCWHCVLLNRSSRKEEQGRYKKRVGKITEYNTDEDIEWIPMDELPWDDPNPKLLEIRE